MSEFRYEIGETVAIHSSSGQPMRIGIVAYRASDVGGSCFYSVQTDFRSHSRTNAGNALALPESALRKYHAPAFNPAEINRVSPSMPII